MSTGVYSVSPLWRYLSQPYSKYRYERTSPLTQVCVFSSMFFVIFLIYFSYFLSRLKQVSLSLELEMRYTTAPCLTGTPHFFNQHLKNQQTSVVDHNTTSHVADPQEYLEISE